MKEKLNGKHYPITYTDRQVAIDTNTDTNDDDDG